MNSGWNGQLGERFSERQAAKAGDRDLLASKNSQIERNGSIQRGFHRELEKANKKCPYQSMAKDGMIEYNGVVFVCDYQKNAICLGDVSDPRQVLNIPLPSGGSLKVNVNNLGDLSSAAGMFTPEDLNAIMRAIHQYHYCMKKLNEIEEEETDPEEKEESTEPGAAAFISEYKTELWYKLMYGQATKTYWIGSQEMTEKEWDNLLENFDNAQEQLREAVEAEMEKRQEDAREKAQIEEIAKKEAETRKARIEEAQIEALFRSRERRENEITT